MNSGIPHKRGKARIFNQRIIAEGYREMKLSYAPASNSRPRERVLPGQFFTILPPHYPLSMMRRPFAYSDSGEYGFTFIYEIRGPVTGDLANLDGGSPVDWIGPLGSAFPEAPADSRPVLVAGGIGVGPILFLARELAEAGTESLVLLGARNAGLVPRLEWPETAEVRICTDDGSYGIHGTALDGLSDTDVTNATFYTCGPHPMMAAVHQLAVDTDRPCWVSMEEMMACGVGACQGCAIPVKDEDDLSRPAYKRACMEGPIFDSRELIW